MPGYNNLGGANERLGSVPERAVIEKRPLKPDDGGACYNLGATYLTLGG